MRFTALYARVSTGRQENGLEAQRRALEAHCSVIGITDFRVFADEAISGSKDKRPALNELMDHVRSGDVEAVVVHSFSRFARSTKHLLDALEVFRANSVAFISLSEKVDTSTPTGRALFTVLGALAQLERELIVERVRTGLQNARLRGRRLGRPRQLDYRRALDLREQGFSFDQIGKLLGSSRSAVHKALSQSASKNPSNMPEMAGI